MSAASAVCLECAAGRYQPSTDSRSCLACLPGQYSAVAGASACSGTVCSAGYAGTSGLKTKAEATCELCVAGRYAPSAGLEYCTPCSAGRFASAGALVCEAGSVCAAGRYGSTDAATGVAQCSDCAPGRYSAAANAAECTECGVGRYANATGQAYACTVSASAGCTSGRYGATGAVSAAAAACAACERGRFAAGPGGTAGRCAACMSGTFANATGAAACHGWPCTAGRFGAAGAGSAAVAECFDCPSMTFQPAAGSEQCTTCGTGFFAAPAQAGCAPIDLVCDAGTCMRGDGGSNIGTRYCWRCSIVDGGFALSCYTFPLSFLFLFSLHSSGYYARGSLLSGQIDCAECPQGHFTATAGAHAGCTACPVGYFASAYHSVACTLEALCQSGEYGVVAATSDTDATCFTCPAGKFASGGGAERCDACVMGRYASGERNTNCTFVRVCSAGRYGTVGAKTAEKGDCASCPPVLLWIEFS